MPRKSAAALELAHSVVAVIPQRKALPRAFRAGSAEAKAWEEITASQSADWFQPGDLPILEAYCRAIVQYRRLSQDIESANNGKGASFTIRSVQGGTMPNPLYAMQDKLGRQMSTYAQKLRLSQSSRGNGTATAVKLRAHADRMAAGNGGDQKPWQRDAS